MKTLLHSIRAIASFALIAFNVACVGPIKYTVTTDRGTETLSIAGIMGGSEAFETASGWRWTGNRNKSFGQAVQGLTTMGSLWANAYAKASEFVFRKFQEGQLTQRQAQEFNYQLKLAAQEQNAAAFSETLKKVPEGSAMLETIKPPSAP